jgi:hypothetical protein
VPSGLLGFEIYRLNLESAYNNEPPLA